MKKTTNTNPLAALEALLNEEAARQLPRQPDEFTAHDYASMMAERGAQLSYQQAARALSRMADEGKLHVRTTVSPPHNRTTNLYRIPTP
jgi:hypothetical protein